jgi:hypothetical protein
VLSKCCWYYIGCVQDTCVSDLRLWARHILVFTSAMRVRFACFIMCVLVAIADKIGNMTALSAADPGIQDKQKPCQRGLLAKWKRFLVARDPKVLFADYDKLLVSKLSAYAASCGAKYPVVYLGVTTAQEDPQADQFRTATHWEGLFVDASQEKTESWTKALEQSEATGRALVVHAVVSDMCRHETVSWVGLS